MQKADALGVDLKTRREVAKSLQFAELIKFVRCWLACSSGPTTPGT